LVISKTTCAGNDKKQRRHMSRDYDIVLIGATGFTGRLTALDIANSAEVKSGLRFAIAGRNAAKLAAVAAVCGNPRIEVVDANDEVALRSLAERSAVIVTTVGPYLQHGLPLATACAKAGTHYADLTGEPPFIRKSIDANHDTATASGARVVHCCGFDSIPSDLGTLLLQEAAIADGGACDIVRYTMMAARGGVSGGTAHSLLGVMTAAAKDPAVRLTMRDPYSLVPHGVRGKDRGEGFSVRFDEDVNSWVGPFFMAPINTRVVRRSNHLLGQRYGDDFSYREQMRTGRGLAGRAAAKAMQLGLGVMVGVAATRAGRVLLDKVLPSPGTGPNEAARESGFFSAHLHGHRSKDGAHFHAVVKGNKDPGYGGTSIMLSQSALCLASDKLTSPGGVTTPAAAMGTPLIERLRAQGMQLSVTQVRESSPS
jgi:short subunit dehydrogenase-like uncharacterized protein